MFMWELSTETNRIETVVVRYGVATIFATVENFMIVINMMNDILHKENIELKHR